MVSSQHLSAITEAITDGDFNQLQNLLEPDNLDYNQQQELIRHADYVHEHAWLSTRDKNILRTVLLALLGAWGYYSYMKVVEYSFNVDGMMANNQMRSKIIGFDANHHAIMGPITPIPQNKILAENHKVNVHMAQVAMAVVAATAIGCEGLMGYYTDRPWYILNHLRTVLTKSPPFRVNVRYT
jgi:hypothetical protein